MNKQEFVYSHCKICGSQRCLIEDADLARCMGIRLKDSGYDAKGEYKPKQFNVPSIYDAEHLIGNITQTHIDATDLYMELLYAVSRKFPNESRHETALRYIREAEQRAMDSDGGVAKESKE